jgi:hypothetical protein
MGQHVRHRPLAYALAEGAWPGSGDAVGAVGAVSRIPRGAASQAEWATLRVLPAADAEALPLPAQGLASRAKTGGRGWR